MAQIAACLGTLLAKTPSRTLSLLKWGKTVMVYRMFALALALTASVAFSQERGSVVIIGNGEASTAPEFAKLRVIVTSLCYETAREAKDANAALAQDLLAILESFVNDPREGITASGGPNIRQTETIQDGQHVKIICQMKWRTTNVLTLQTSGFNELADLQDQLLAAIDQATAQPSDSNQIAQSYAELSQASFYVYDETLVNLRKTAQEKAFADAKIQFGVFAGTCPLEEVRLIKIHPPRQDIVYRHDGRMMAADETPVIPDEISVAASWEFEWSFLASQACATKRRL